MVIDTGKISTALAVAWLEESIKRLGEIHPTSMPAVQSVRIDPVLADSIATVLDKRAV